MGTLCKKLTIEKLKTWFLCLAAILPHAAQAVTVSPRLQLYSETQYLSYAEDLISQNKLQLNLWGPEQGWVPYFGFALEQDSKSNSRVVFNDNHVAPLAGIKVPLPLLPITLFTEARQRFRLIDKPDMRQSTETELRAGGYLFQWWDLTRASRPVNLFDELYGESVASTNVEGSLSSMARNRLGARFRTSPKTAVDLFLQGQGNHDVYGNASRSTGYGSVGFRLNAFFGPSSGALILQQAFINGNIWTASFVLSGEF